MKTALREIVFDTETTGLSPDGGDRLVEIGAIELVNHIPTGRTYHQYINPERSVPEEVVAVHGLTEEFLKDYPVFRKWRPLLWNLSVKTAFWWRITLPLILSLLILS